MQGSWAPPETIRAAAAAGSQNSLSTLWILMRKKWQQRDYGISLSLTHTQTRTHTHTHKVYWYKMQGRGSERQHDMKNNRYSVNKLCSTLHSKWSSARVKYCSILTFNFDPVFICSKILSQNHFNKIAETIRFTCSQTISTSQNFEGTEATFGREQTYVKQRGLSFASLKYVHFCTNCTNCETCTL